MWEKLFTPDPSSNYVHISKATCGSCSCSCAQCNCQFQGHYKDGAGSAMIRSFGNATAEVVDPPAALDRLGM